MSYIKTDAGEWLSLDAVIYVHPTEGTHYGIEIVLKYGEKVRWWYTEKELRDKVLNQLLDQLTSK